MCANKAIKLSSTEVDHKKGAQPPYNLVAYGCSSGIVECRMLDWNVYENYE